MSEALFTHWWLWPLWMLGWFSIGIYVGRESARDRLPARRRDRLPPCSLVRLPGPVSRWRRLLRWLRPGRVL